MSHDRKWLGKQNIDFGGLAKRFVYNASATGSNEAIATVNTDGYFNDDYKDLAVNDIITIVATDGIFTAIVNKNDWDPAAQTGSVDITDGVAITATDSD